MGDIVYAKAVVLLYGFHLQSISHRRIVQFETDKQTDRRTNGQRTKQRRDRNKQTKRRANKYTRKQSIGGQHETRSHCMRSVSGSARQRIRQLDFRCGFNLSYSLSLIYRSICLSFYLSVHLSVHPPTLSFFLHQFHLSVSVHLLIYLAYPT